MYNTTAAWLTPSWVDRTNVRRWWLKNGGYEGNNKPHHVSIYNNGRHVFVENLLSPGTFINPPHSLKMLSFMSALNGISFGNIRITHHGHLRGVDGGDALVSISNGRYIISPLQIRPGHILYVMEVRTTGSIDGIMVYAPLPGTILSY